MPSYTYILFNIHASNLYSLSYLTCVFSSCFRSTQSSWWREHCGTTITYFHHSHLGSSQTLSWLPSHRLHRWATGGDVWKHCIHWHHPHNLHYHTGPGRKPGVQSGHSDCQWLGGICSCNQDCYDSPSWWVWLYACIEVHTHVEPLYKGHWIRDTSLMRTVSAVPTT